MNIMEKYEKKLTNLSKVCLKYINFPHSTVWLRPEGIERGDVPLAEVHPPPVLLRARLVRGNIRQPHHGRIQEWFHLSSNVHKILS